MNARMKGRGRFFTCECIDELLLSSFFKEPTLKLTPAGANTAENLKYLTDMVHAVINFDKEYKRYTSAPLASASRIMLSLSRPMPEDDPRHVCGFLRSSWLKRLSSREK
jgi:hypothetical protein